VRLRRTGLVGGSHQVPRPVALESVRVVGLLQWQLPRPLRRLQRVLRTPAGARRRGGMALTLVHSHRRVSTAAFQLPNRHQHFRLRSLRWVWRHPLPAHPQTLASKTRISQHSVPWAGSTPAAHPAAPQLANPVVLQLGQKARCQGRVEAAASLQARPLGVRSLLTRRLGLRHRPTQQLGPLVALDTLGRFFMHNRHRLLHRHRTCLQHNRPLHRALHQRHLR